MQDGSKITNGELFARTQSGDRAAFGDLIERHKDGLVNYLTRLCGNPEEAEDLAQEAFLRLYERGEGYREQGQLKAYLYRIATNLYRSHQRRAQRWRRLGLLFLNSNGHFSEAAQQAAVLRDELGRQLTQALLEIPIRYRVPVILAYVEGWTHRDIARVLKCQEGTVKSRLHRGRQRLQQHLDAYRNGGQS